MKLLIYILFITTQIIPIVNIDDNLAFFLASSLYGNDARLARNYVNSPIGFTIQYCIGLQEYIPDNLVTLIGTIPNPRAGQPLPTITWKQCGSSWDDAITLVLKNGK